MTVARLLARFGSKDADCTLTAFRIKLPAALAVTVSVTVWLAPLASVPKLQTTVPPVAVQPVEEDSKLTLAGKVSVIVTLLAVIGPKFVTTIV